MKKYRRLWVICILSALTIFALLRLGNIDISFETLARVNLGWYALVVVSFYASIIARGWRWQGILKAMGWPVGFVYATALLTTGLFTSAILPARAGDIGRVAILKQDHKIPIAQGIASIASERALDVFSILTLAMIAAWLALPGRIPPEVLQLMLGVGVLFILGLVGLLIIPGIENWLREGRLVKKMVPTKGWSFFQKMLDFGFSLIEGVRMLGRKPGSLVIAIGQSFLIWIWDALMIYFILISLGIVAPFSMSLFTAMISDLMTAVPLTPGALGQFDATLISLLTLFGLTRSDSSLTTLLLRLIQLWTFIPISGLATYIFGFSRVLNLDSTKINPPQVPPVSTSPASNLAES